MKISITLFVMCFLVGCNSMANGFAELTGLSFLHDRRSSSVITTDENIEDSAIIELHRLDDVQEHAHVNITSYNGKVLVTGEAKTEEIREKIIANIRIISGVKLVHNEIVLGPVSSLSERSNDAIMTIKAKDALADIKDKPGFDATRVKVITEQKVIYLMGLVHEQEGVTAAKALQNISGVSKIVTVFEYIDYTEQK